MADVERFEAFVRTYQDMVYATAVRLLGNPAEAEDVAQSVFLKAFEQFDSLSTSPAAAGWLKTVARNTCLNHLSRYRARWQFFSELDRAGESGTIAFADSVAARDTEDEDVQRQDRDARRRHGAGTTRSNATNADARVAASAARISGSPAP